MQNTTQICTKTRQTTKMGFKKHIKNLRPLLDVRHVVIVTHNNEVRGNLDTRLATRFTSVGITRNFV